MQTCFVNVEGEHADHLTITTITELVDFSFSKDGPIPASFSACFGLFKTSQFEFKINKSVDSVLGIQTWGGLCEGADESTQLQRHPTEANFFRNRFWSFPNFVRT